MQSKFLLPHKCRLVGALLLPLAAAWLITFYIGDHSVFPFLQYKVPGPNDGGMFPGEFLFSKRFATDFNGELSILATLVCLFMVAFSREKREDEYVRTLRLRALQVSIYINYFILALASILVYGFSYIIVLQANLFTLPLVFIIIFYYNLHIRPRISKTPAL